MALKSKKQQKLYVTGSGDITGSVFFIDAATEASASASFAKGTHIQNRHYFNQNKALFFQLKLVEQDIDEMRRFTEQSVNKVIDTTTEALRIVTGSIDGGAF